MGDVHSLNGGPVGQREVIESAVKVLEEALERAQSGDIMGVALVYLHHDGAASYDLAGRIGGYSMQGALTNVSWRLSAINETED